MKKIFYVLKFKNESKYVTLGFLEGNIFEVKKWTNKKECLEDQKDMMLVNDTIIKKFAIVSVF